MDSLFRADASATPSSFQRVSLIQLIRADCELWTILAREHFTVKPNAHGDKPLDQAIEKLRSDPRVVMHLMALLGRSLPAEKPSSSASAANRVQPKKKFRLGKQGRTAPAVPEELKNLYQRTTNGKPICWAFNLSSGCQQQTGGNPPSCSRGAHVCAFCRKPGHGYQTCRFAKSDAKPGDKPKP